MNELIFLFRKKIIAELKDKTILALMYFVMKMDSLIRFMYQEFVNSMDSLLITDENKSHYVYIKDFNKKIKTKKIFENVAYSVLVVNQF